MRILITGKNGYLGTLLTKHLAKQGHNIKGIDRQLLYTGGQALKDDISSGDTIINLAGAPILQRWNKANKATIFHSRITTTRNLVTAINQLDKTKRPRKFISISAIGIYANNHFHTEDSTDYNPNFLGHIAQEWERALNDLDKSVLCHVFRLGVVLGREAVLIKKMYPIFKLGLGGKIGNGKQPFPFVHERDVVSALTWAVKELDKNTVLNLVAPENIDNARFTRELGSLVNKPTYLSVPAWALKLIYGKACTVMLDSPSVSSQKIQDLGFEFKYPTIVASLLEIFSKTTTK